MIPLHAGLGLTSWTWEPTVLAGLAALALAYGWLMRTRGQSMSWSPLARIYFAGGLVVLFAALTCAASGFQWTMRRFLGAVGAPGMPALG